MRKKYFLLLGAAACLSGRSLAQQILPCHTDEMNKIYRQQHPEILIYEKQLEDEIQRFISHRSPNALGKTTENHSDTDWYDIPLVVHVMHNYGPEFLPDTAIYKLVAEMNRFYSLQNDTTPVIKPFKKWVGKAKFRFHLATIDPLGNPTKGITRRLTYLTYGGDDQVKMDQWQPASYVNIWFENVIGAGTVGGIIVAYATPPSTAAATPQYDGIISNYSFIGDANNPGASGGSIDHEMGHIFNLQHTWGNTNDPGLACGDDGVDDTPPTKGILGGCPVNDTTCATNYYKVYTTAAGTDSLVNYPDTVNTQNLMNYADCKYMFTKGQVTRMRAALNSDIASRSNLWQPANLAATGALAPIPDLQPIPEFYSKNGVSLNYFTFPNTPITFVNKSWQDTVTAVSWSFSNDATPLTSASITSVATRFNQPGWVSLTMTATGNNSGMATKTFDHAAFVADAEGVDATTYFEDFDPSGKRDKWPMFNYYGNEFKWEIANVGMYDGYSVKYNGFDTRINPAANAYPLTGRPGGDYDDMFSIPINLSAYSGGTCYLNFYSSAASRSASSQDIKDTLIIEYSINKSLTWNTVTKLTKNDLINKGAIPDNYTPSTVLDWAPRALKLPAAAVTNYTVFRFRYKPGVGRDLFTSGNTYSTGNNFYMDRLNFSSVPAGINETAMNKIDAVVVPNPTHGNAYVIVKDADNATAHIVVSDVTGKVIYSTSEQVSGNTARIEIPHAAISVQGMYLVQTTTGNQTSTQKLVVY
jgi:hypothetical protein